MKCYELSFPVVHALRALGHDVLTSLDAGKANQRIPDDEVLAFATSMDRAVLTFNRHDFIRLHTTTAGGHAGIITCRTDADYPALTARIHGKIAPLPELRGMLVRVNRR